MSPSLARDLFERLEQKWVRDPDWGNTGTPADYVGVVPGVAEPPD